MFKAARSFLRPRLCIRLSHASLQTEVFFGLRGPIKIDRSRIWFRV